MLKKLLLLFFVVFTLLPACSRKLGSISNGKYPKAYKEAFIDGFKTLTFCKCVQYGNPKMDDLAKEDVSCRVPDYLFMEMNVIDSLAKAEIIKLQLDSFNRAGRVAEGMDGKRTIIHCLEQYQSKKLNSFAKNRFHKEGKRLRQ